MNSIQSLFLTAEVGEALSSSSASISASSLAAKMEAEKVTNGHVVFHPSGSFASFVRAVENSVFIHLFGACEEEREVVKGLESSTSKQGLHELGKLAGCCKKANEDILHICARELIRKAKSLFVINRGETDDTLFDEMNVYTVRPIAAIRMSIRVLIMECKPGPYTVFVELDEVFTALHERDPRFQSFEDVGRGLRNYAKTLETLAHLHIHYITLKDDPYADVLHFSSRHISSTSKSPHRVTISRCGIDFVRGEYTRSIEGHDQVCYFSRHGCTISRTKQRIRDDAAMDDFVYVWFILSEERRATYYSCATAEGSVIPPSYGWHTVDSGILPAPLILMKLQRSDEKVSPRDQGTCRELIVTESNYCGKHLVRGEMASNGEDDMLHGSSEDSISSEVDQVGLLQQQNQPQQLSLDRSDVHEATA